jgi:hypothetical protein
VGPETTPELPGVPTLASLDPLFRCVDGNGATPDARTWRRVVSPVPRLQVDSLRSIVRGALVRLAGNPTQTQIESSSPAASGSSGSRMNSIAGRGCDQPPFPAWALCSSCRCSVTVRLRAFLRQEGHPRSPRRLLTFPQRDSRGFVGFRRTGLHSDASRHLLPFQEGDLRSSLRYQEGSRLEIDCPAIA